MYQIIINTANKFRLLFLLITLLSLVACDNISVLNDLEKENIHGSIKTITTSSFYYDSTKAEPHLGKLKEKTIREFNLDGYEVKSTAVNDEDEVERIVSNLFNEKKQRTEQKECDEEGNVLSITNYKYDKKNNLIEITSTNLNTNEKTKQINEYDKENNLISSTVYKGNNEIEYKVLNKYDETKMLIEEKYILGNGEIDYRSIYKYDEKKNVISNVGYDKDGNKVFDINYKYQVFDKEGNCLLKYLNLDGKLVNVIQTQIEYNQK